MLKKLLIVTVSVATCSAFAINYHHKSSIIRANLGPQWKMVDKKLGKHITVRGYIPKGEKTKYYSKMVAVGQIKKEPGREKEQIKLFDHHKKKYLLENGCSIKDISNNEFKNFNAESTTAFRYSCKKLRISGVDVTLNADDKNSIYNVIYEFRSPALTPELDKEAMDALAKMKICYDNDPNC